MSTGRFDDGNREVPGGIAEPVRRVLVVGAGIAGLTVANALHHAGVEYVVLEARGRVGGRLHTVDLAGSPVDLGGSWMHHPSGNPLRRFAREAGVECRPGDPLPTLSAFDVAHRAVALARGRRGEPDRRPRGFRPGPRCAARAVGPAGLRRRRDRGVPGHDRARGRAVATSAAGAPGERRGGRGRCGRAAVAGVAVDAGRVRRRLLRRPASRAGTSPSWTPWPVGSTSASTGRWSGST